MAKLLTHIEMYTCTFFQERKTERKYFLNTIDDKKNKILNY